MFRESLGSTTDALDKVEHETPSAETDTRGCRAFIEVFSPSGHVAAAGPSSQQASVKEKKRAAVKVTSQRPRPIDGWLDRCSSAEPGSASDKQSASSKSSSQLPRGRISTSLETDDDDDDFQSTKARPALRQTQIAVHRVSKKQQAFLDDLDDDLNVAKAMSLSLKRGPDPAANGGKGAAAKRRDNSSGRADALAKSDILACSEAQSFIQQRAAVLEKMDEENPPIASLLYPRTGKAVAVFDNSKLSDSTTPPRLWDMGALPTATGREYCEIFESYKVCRSGHASSDACLDNTVGRMLMALSLEEQDQLGCSAKSDQPDETALRRGYMRLLRAVHGSFARQATTMRTAKWVESGNASISSEAEDGASEGVIILSSSPQSDPETDQHSVESLHRVEDSPLRPTSSALTIAEKRKAVVSVKAPDYTKLAHAELQGLAEKYGLRTNTPKRLLIHQLQTIWEQTNTKRPSADITSKLPDTAVPERADEDVQPLFDQLRRHIRGNIDLFEQILCYRVLDFDAVYQDVSTAVKCQKAVLRKFFDLEGIVYSSYHD